MEKEKLLNKLTFGEFKTQSDYLADKIKNMIISGEFEYGFVFPNENEFCKILNVSRGTLRDAYKKLATQGFIERKKTGTYVKGKEIIAKQGNYSATLELAPEQEMVEFICAFEPEAVCMAAEKIDDEKIVFLEQLMIECEECGTNIEALNAANYRFHEFIRMHAENDLVISVLTAYYDSFNREIVDTIYDLLKENSDEFRLNALKQHRALVAAIKKRDGELARKIAKEHLLDDKLKHLELKCKKGAENVRIE